MDAAQFLSYIASGLWVTLAVTAASLAIALVVGLLVALARTSPFAVVRALAATFVEFFRGTSEIVQLFFAYFALPLIFGYQIAPVAAAAVVLGLNHGAYMSEIFRSGLSAVPRSQSEGVIALNLPRVPAFLRIILPQALPRILPPLGNQAIDLLKATSIVSLITVADVTFRAQQIRSLTGDSFLPFAAILAIYFLLSTVIGAGVKYAERAAAIGPARRTNLVAGGKA